MENASTYMLMEPTRSNLGRKGKDKITGFEGVIVGECHYLFGCKQYGITPQTFNKETGARPETQWFDEGRIEISSTYVVEPIDVQAERPGADFNFDTPKC